MGEARSYMQPAADHLGRQAQDNHTQSMQVLMNNISDLAGFSMQMGGSYSRAIDKLKREETIQVTPLENPFHKKPPASLASSETTKRLICVKGGTTPDLSAPNSFATAITPQQIQNANNSDGDDENIVQSAGATM